MNDLSRCVLISWYVDDVHESMQTGFCSNLITIRENRNQESIQHLPSAGSQSRINTLFPRFLVNIVQSSDIIRVLLAFEFEYLLKSILAGRPRRVSAWDTSFVLCMCPVPGYDVLEAINFIRIAGEGRKVVADAVVKLDCDDREFRFGSVPRVVPSTNILISLDHRQTLGMLTNPIHLVR